MKHRFGTAILVGRASGGSVLAAASAGTVALWLVIPPRPIAVLGQSDVFAVVWPLVPAAFAAVVPAALGGLDRELESVATRPAWGRRALALALVGLLALPVVCAGQPIDPVVALRNTVLLVGLGLLGLVLLPAAWAWAPVVVFASANWLVGVRPGGQVRPWAVLLRPADDQRAATVAAVVALLGAVTVLARGHRPAGAAATGFPRLPARRRAP